MPRWKMAQDDDTFKSLLELLESQHEVAKEATGPYRGMWEDRKLPQR